MKEETLGKKIWRVIYPLITYNAVSYVVAFAATYIITAFVAVGKGTISTQDAYVKLREEVYTILVTYTYEIQATAALIAIPLMLYYMRRDRKRRTAAQTLHVYQKVQPQWLGLVLALGFSASIVANNLMLMSGLQQSVEGYEELVALMFKGNLVIELLGLGLIIPIAEELVFRVLMYGRLKEFVDFRLAALSAAACFGAAHGNLVQAIFGFFLGLLMIYVYERYHSAWAPILFHVVSNVLAVLQEETTLLDPFYSSRTLFFVSTFVMAIVVVGMVMLIEKFVISEELEVVYEEPAAEAVEE